MKKDDCIFCKLSNGDIPTNALYEDDVVKVIFDLNPASKGHVLILPKNHFDDIAGQTVFHFHMHIIPRYKGDTVNIGWTPGKADADEINELKEKIAAGL